MVGQGHGLDREHVLRVVGRAGRRCWPTPRALFMAWTGRPIKKRVGPGLFQAAGVSGPREPLAPPRTGHRAGRSAAAKPQTPKMQERQGNRKPSAAIYVTVARALPTSAAGGRAGRRDVAPRRPRVRSPSGLSTRATAGAMRPQRHLQAPFRTSTVKRRVGRARRGAVRARGARAGVSCLFLHPWFLQVWSTHPTSHHQR